VTRDAAACRLRPALPSGMVSPRVAAWQAACPPLPATSLTVGAVATAAGAAALHRPRSAPAPLPFGHAQAGAVHLQCTSRRAALAFGKPH